MKELVLKLRILGTSKEIETLQQLKTAIKENNVELSKTKIGSDEYKRLTNQIADATALSKQLTAEQKQQVKAFESLRFASGSYRELQASVSVATEKLRQMSVGVNATQEEFDALKIRIQDGKVKLADFDRELSASNQLVGEYDRGIVKAFKDLGLVDIAKKQLTSLEATQATLIAQLNTLEKEYQEAGQSGKRSADIVETELKQVVAQLSRVNQNVEVAKKELGGLGSIGQQVTGGLINGFKAIGGAVLVGFGAVSIFQKMTQTAGEAVEAFKAQEKADDQLRESLNEVGEQADVTFSKLKQQAESLQNTTIFSDDQIQQSQKALAQFGLTGEEIEKLIPLISDFASQTNQDFDTATEAIIRGLAGQERGLKKYDSTIALTADDTQGNLEKISKSLERFAGGSETLVNTAEGNARRTVNLIEDRLERLGGLLVPFEESANKFKLAIVDGLVGSLEGLIAPAKKASDEFKTQQTRVNELQNEIVPLANRYDELTSKGELNKDEQTELNTIIQRIAQSVPGAVTAFDEYGKALGINTDAVKKNLEQQQAILRVKNKEAIEAQSEALSDVNSQLTITTSQFQRAQKYTELYGQAVTNFQKQIPELEKEVTEAQLSGDKFRSYSAQQTLKQVQAALENARGSFENSSEQLENLRAKLQELGGEKTGIEGLLNELKGIPQTVEQTGEDVVSVLTDIEKKQIQTFKELVDKKRQTDVKLSESEIEQLNEALKKVEEKRKQEQEKRKEEIEKNTDEIIQLSARLGKSLADAQIEAIENETTREIAKRNQAFEEEKQSVIENLNDINDAEDEAVKLGAKTREQAEREKQAAKEQADLTIKNLEIKLQSDLKEIQTQGNKEQLETTLKGISDRLKLIDEEYSRKILGIKAKGVIEKETESEVNQQLIQNDLERLREQKKVIDERLSAAQAGAEGAVVIDENEKKELLRQQEDFNNEIILKEKENQDALDQIREEGRQKQLGKAQEVLGILNEFTSVLGDIFQTQADNQIADIEGRQEVINERISELEAKKETAGEADKRRLDKQINNERSQLKKLDKEKEEINRKAAIKAKAVAILAAIINTALAVTNALATVQPFLPAGVAAGVLAGALGAVQVGIIAAQPLSKGGKLKGVMRNLRTVKRLADGGDITNVTGGFIPRGSGTIVAPRHSANGVSFEYNGNRYEAEGGELKTNNGKDRYIFTRGVGQDATLRKLALATHGNSFHPGAKMVASLVNQMGGGRSFMERGGALLASGGSLGQPLPQPNVVIKDNSGIDLSELINSVKDSNKIISERIDQVEKNFNDTKIAVPVDEVTDIQTQRTNSRAAGMF